MKNSVILSNEARLALPGSFMLGDIQFITGERHEYRQLNFVPMDRLKARQALGIPDCDFLLLIKDDFEQPEVVIQLLPDLLMLLPPKKRGQLCLMGGALDIPDPDFCKGLAAVDRHLESTGCKWKWFFTGQKQEKWLKYYYSAANLVVMSFQSNTLKLKELLQSMVNPLNNNRIAWGQ